MYVFYSPRPADHLNYVLDADYYEESSHTKISLSQIAAKKKYIFPISFLPDCDTLLCPYMYFYDRTL